MAHHNSSWSIKEGFIKKQHFGWTWQVSPGLVWVEVLSRETAKAVSEVVRIRKSGAKGIFLGSPHSVLYP